MQFSHPAILKRACIWRSCAAAFLISCGITASGAPATPSLENLPTLTNIAQIRALMPHDAERHFPVCIHAVVTFGNLGRLCFIQDETGAIFLRRSANSTYLHPGQMVEVTGTTLPGDWAPIIRETGIKIVGERELPPPKPATFDELNTGKADCQRVEVRGIVRAAKSIADHLHLEIALGGGRMRAYVYDFPYKNVSELINSTVCIRGTAGGIFNHKKQFAAPLLFASGTNSMVVEQPSASDPFAAPLLSAGSLLQYAPGIDYDHRVKVTGVVTYQEPGQAIFIRDGIQGLCIETPDKTLAKPGDTIEAAGFPVMGRYTPTLEDAVFRVTGSVQSPAPLPITTGDALSGKMDANLVQLDARMIDLLQRGNEYILVLQTSNVVFNAHLPQIKGAEEGLEKDSQLRVSGICSIRDVRESVSFLNPQSFELLLRSPRDIIVLQRPPWWTLSRLLWILGAMTVVILVGVAWVVVLNRRVNEQTQIIQHRVQREAVLEERSRIAREFHDTLEQELAGIALQLDTVAVHMKASPSLAVRQLEMARNLSRHTLAEARRSVWDLRSHLLANNNLATALTEAARQFENGQVKIDFQASGTPRKLPARVENNFLRIAQEALTNAMKHSRANNILMRLQYQPETTCLSIKDDGVGFDVALAAGIEGGHFGLLGMRERAERCGASFSLQSSPGSGTIISVESRCMEPAGPDPRSSSG